MTSEKGDTPTLGASQNCHRCASPLALDDLRCAICALPVPPAQSAITTTTVQVLRCDVCGAALSYDVRVQAPLCGFCGSATHLEERDDPLEQPSRYLPFRVRPEEAERALRAWLASLGWFRPSALSASAAIASFKPLWWVGWTFSVDALVSWSADSDEGAGQARWAPYATQVNTSVSDVLVSASRGLTEKETSQLFPLYDLSSGQAQPDAMDGASLECFDVQRSRARTSVQQAVVAHARRQAKQWVPGKRVRKLQVAVLPRGLTTERYAFPAYVFAYRYQGQLYRAIVHGQNARQVIGEAPYSWLKISFAVAGASLALLVACVCAGAAASILQ